MKIIILLVVIYGTTLAYGNELKTFCPMEIIPAKRIGPLSFLSNLISIKNLFPKAIINTHKSNLHSGTMVFVENKGLHIYFCNDTPQDIWIDLQKFPKDCLIFKGKKISPKLSIKEMKTIFGGCKTQDLRTGGTFYQCKNGLRLGIGSGGNQKVVDQIRLGSSLDIKCLPFK